MDKKLQTKISKMVESKSVPNILFYGPYLCGKEELCKQLIIDIYKTREQVNKFVLMINCLSNKGIKTIKEHIKLFSMQVLNTTRDVSFKTIVLMHSENLTYESQYSLRRTIEQYNKTTRFVLLCENKYQLLSPICSRFAHFYVNNGNYSKKIHKHLDKFNYGKFNTILAPYFSGLSTNTLDLKTIYKTSLLLYNNNYNAFEVLNKFSANPNYNSINLIFADLNRNLRNELMSIFYLLAIFRNNSKIQIYEYY